MIRDLNENDARGCFEHQQNLQKMHGSHWFNNKNNKQLCQNSTI